MHHHLEIVMPNTDNIEQRVSEILEPFDENNEEAYNSFWDFYVIGGRSAGQRLQSSLDEEKLSQFNEEMKKMKLTISGIQCGKQELKPSSQIQKVDELWSSYFPNTGSCPYFSHSNDQYSSNDLIVDDVMNYSKSPKDMKCNRVVFAGLSYDEKRFDAKYMTADSHWNGVNFEDSVWNGTIKHAEEMFCKAAKRYKDYYREKVLPNEDSIIITIDYHS